MARQIIRQPDGKWSEYSTISDSFIMINCTKKEIIAEAEKEAAEDARERYNQVFDDLDKGIVRGIFALTYEKALKNHNRNSSHKI